MKRIIEDFVCSGDVRKLTDSNREMNFVALDVGLKLGYTMASNIGRLVDQSERKIIAGPTNTGPKKLVCLTPKGLMQAILASRNDKAKPYVAEILENLESFYNIGLMVEGGAHAARVAENVAAKQAQVVAEDPFPFCRKKEDWALLLQTHCGYIANSVNDHGENYPPLVEELAARCNMWLQDIEERRLSDED